MKSDENRIEYIDLLRILATLGIIIIHTAARNWYNTEVNSIEWQTFNFYDAIARCFVPIFFMISGALFLSKEYPIKKIYSKYILRIITAFIFWTIVYSIVFFSDKGIKTMVKEALTGYYHMWFLFVIVELYMLVPIFKKIVENERLTTYFLIIIFLFQTIIPQISVILVFFKQSTLANIVNTNMGKLIYLLHAMILEELNLKLNFNSLSFNPILSVPTITVFVFFICYALTSIINKIPVVKKYII